MLAVLSRFNGMPTISDDGVIVYRESRSDRARPKITYRDHRTVTIYRVYLP